MGSETGSVDDDLRRLLAEHRGSLEEALQGMQQGDEGYYECPLCGGEGTVDAEVVSTGATLVSEQLEQTGIQVFGWGNQLDSTKRLLLLLLRETPRILDERDKLREQVERSDYNPHHGAMAPKIRAVLADGKVHGVGEIMKACGVEVISDVTHVLHELQAMSEVTYHGYGEWQRV